MSGSDDVDDYVCTMWLISKDDQLEPGRPYRGMAMKAFLPASGDGRETLRLMKAVFTARKLFMLEGKPDVDVIVPNGVVFKDNMSVISHFKLTPAFSVSRVLYFNLLQNS